MFLQNSKFDDLSFEGIIIFRKDTIKIVEYFFKYFIISTNSPYLIEL